MFFKILGKTTNKRNFGLDLIRAIAILMVVFNHSRFMLLSLVDIPIIGYLIGKIIASSVLLGVLGVELFFVLSGFLIGGILLQEIVKNQRIDWKLVKHFWIRRWFRTLPTYFLILLFHSILFYFLYNIQFDWRFIFFIQNFATAHPDFFSEAWSLSIEEWSYLLIPIFLLTAFAITKATTTIAIIQRFIIVYILFSVILRCLNAFFGIFGDFHTEIPTIVLLRLDAIAFGILTYLLSKRYPYFIMNNKALLFSIGLLVIISLTFFNYKYYYAIPVLGYNPTYQFFFHGFFYTIIPIGFSLIVLYASFFSVCNLTRFRNAITHISLISYPIYLIHLSLIGKTFFFKYKFENDILTASFFIFYLVSVFILSTLIHKYYELPFLKLRDKYS